MKKFFTVLLPAILFSAIFFVNSEAEVFYTPGEYRNLFNEKVAVEIELKSVREQFSNEKSNLESKIKQLESEIANLNKKIAMLEKQSAEDKAGCESRIKELKDTINVLQSKGSNREKELLEENKKMRLANEEEMKKLREQLKAEREKNIKDTDSLKKEYDKKIALLESQIKSLNDEIANLRQLNKSQKAELERMSEQANELEKQLKDEIGKGQIRLKKMYGKLIINIDDKISFDSGSASLKKEILPALDKISQILAAYPENTIVIEGHTDNIPIIRGRFRDNWHLSTERALSVLEFILNKNKSLNKARFAASGYGEFNPIVANDTPENRSLNRRVDIVVVPRISK